MSYLSMTYCNKHRRGGFAGRGRTEREGERERERERERRNRPDAEFATPSSRVSDPICTLQIYNIIYIIYIYIIVHVCTLYAPCSSRGRWRG